MVTDPPGRVIMSRGVRPDPDNAGSKMMRNAMGYRGRSVGGVAGRRDGRAPAAVCRGRAAARRRRPETGQAGVASAYSRQSECERAATRWRDRAALGGPLGRYRDGGYPDRGGRQCECQERLQRDAAVARLHERQRRDGGEAAGGGRERELRRFIGRDAADALRAHGERRCGQGSACAQGTGGRAEHRAGPDRADVGGGAETSRGGRRADQGRTRTSRRARRPGSRRCCSPRAWEM